MTATVLELRGLTKRYGREAAVNGVSLAVGAGEFLTFLGPSGSGKTTTLMMIAGLLAPDAGEIRLGGADIGRLPAWKRDLGMVFQHYALFPHMTVARNIAFPLEQRGLRRAEIAARVEAALQMVSLGGLGARRPSQLSGGQQQRAALARALVYRPPLLLMDEPLGALDRKLREQLQLEILRLHRAQRMSVLYVTHDQDEALTMSDRIAVFNGGQIEQLGTPSELYERPATRFVAGFVGEMNFLPVTVLQAEGDGWARAAAGETVLRVRNPTGVAPGSKAVLAVRPERLVWAPDDATGLAARCEATIFAGNARRHLMRLPDGTALTMRRPASDVAPRDKDVRLMIEDGQATIFPP